MRRELVDDRALRALRRISTAALFSCRRCGRRFYRSHSGRMECPNCLGDEVAEEVQVSA